MKKVENHELECELICEGLQARINRQKAYVRMQVIIGIICMLLGTACLMVAVPLLLIAEGQAVIAACSFAMFMAGGFFFCHGGMKVERVTRK